MHGAESAGSHGDPGSRQGIVAKEPRRRPRALFALAICLVGACSSACAKPPDADSLRALRLALVGAIEAEGVRDSSTLAALRVVPRHEFVPPEYRRLAYWDEALPIGHGQTISQPSVVATMTEALHPRPGMKVLEIGTGSGYQAAVLAQIGCRVYTIEIIPALAEGARARLKRTGYGSVRVRTGDGYLGWPEAAPFDAIILTAAPEEVPPVLVAQLAAGGRLVAPVGREGEVQELTLIEKDVHGALKRTALLPVRFVPMRKGAP